VDALEVIHVIMERWASEEVKEVVLVAPIYVNPFIFETKLKTYLPLTRKRVEEEVESDINVEPQEASFFEPSKEEAIDRIAQLLVESLFIESFYELKATEYSSRMVAMKQATEAAGDRIKLLTNVFNRARQSAITQQLSELAAANEAMSSENQYETFEV
jgi:F-type H+-transporting ATPase subunit gamma